ncbi:peroxide stress protein YaaA [Lewinella cohaerens]|uniref:peroxide stress protein YaaA n=1 Tax=Lewinella cohaerens TaxID=70995 RepID=UPI00037F1AD2|nr:peroxide stress protein YaaA [Lewinella cohaerens]
MIILLSPAKTLDETPVHGIPHTEPRLLPQSAQLIKNLRRKSVADLQGLMKISEKLAVLNKGRYKTYSETFTEENAKPAALMFKGDVYTGLEANSFTDKELAFAQEHIRILSGLYGLLRPLDLIQPYRLEMGTSLKLGRKKNLYEFWGDKITELVQQDLDKATGDTVLNLASQEYFQSVKTDKLKGRLINIHFKEDRDGKLKVISFNAKKARGKMAQLIVKEQITEAEQIKELVADDYIYQKEGSTDSDWLFVK